MLLKSSNKYPAIIETIFIALLFFGGTGVFAAHLALAGDWSAIFNSFDLALIPIDFLFLLLLCVIIIVVFFALYGFFWRERTLSAAAQGDSRALTPAPTQPDQHLALQPGETLSLERGRGVGNIVSGSVFTLVCAVVIALTGEVLVFTLLPAFSHSTLNPFYALLIYGYSTAPAAPQPTALDWITAAFPLVLSLLLITYTLTLITQRRCTLIADDQGLTLRRHLQPRRFIPWEDVALFIQLGKNRSGNVSESYLLWGREHRLTIEIIRLPAAPDTLKKSRAAWVDKLDTYRFAGGFERYAADAQRILATIAARGHAPLQTFAGEPAIVTRIKRRSPDRLTLDDLLAAPLAGKELQPAVQDTDATEPITSTITLKERLPIRSLLLETVLWFIIIGVVVFIFGRVTIQTTFSEITSLPAYWVIIILAACAAFVAVMAFGLVWPRHRRRAPIIITSPDGLTQKTAEPTITLPWDEMRAWAIKPSPDHTQPQRTYIVCSERATLAWTERPDAALAGKGIQGDRHQAYQEQAAQLHSLIAARTGLPLREVTSR